jgi:thioredoxin 1
MIEIQSKEHLLGLLKSVDIAVVDFFATWCTPCKDMAAYLEKVQAVNPELPIAKINVDELREVADLFDVTVLPTLLFIYKGNVIHRVNGIDMKSVNTGLEKLNSL